MFKRLAKTVNQNAMRAFFALAMSSLPMASMAGPYDGTETRPGTEISNSISIDYSVLGFEQVTLTSGVTFVVQPNDTFARLRAFEYTPGRPGAETWSFPASAFKSGDSFLPMNAPRDMSDSEFKGQTLPVPGLLEVSEVERIKPSKPIFFVLENDSLNFDSKAIDTVEVTIRDVVTGDEELVLFYETGPDTGAFTAWVETRQENPALSDGWLGTVPLSRIDATYADAFNVVRNLEDQVTVGPVDPFGLIFDSTTGAPVNGIEITIMDAATNEPAVVYGDDLISIYPSTIVTGGVVTDSSGETYDLEPGNYMFPYVDIGEYYFEITPNDNYSFPTTRVNADLQNLPGGPFTLVAGSRLDVFPVVPGPSIRIDIAADRRDIAQVTRDANVDVAEIGDFIEYTVEVIPSEDGVISIRDSLTDGMRVLLESVRVDDRRVGTRLNEDGTQLFIDDYVVTKGKPIVLTYIAQLSVFSTPQTSIRTRTDIEGDKLRKSFDIHDLSVRQAFDLDTVSIIGDITSGACGEEDENVDLSGIRVFLEDGQYAVTDRDGRFSFRNVSNHVHVVQLDELTLPLGATPVLCETNVRNSGSSISQFVDVKPGLLGRAEFRIQFEDQESIPAANAQVSLPALSEITDYEGDGAAHAGYAPAPSGVRDAGYGQSRVSFDQEWLDTRPADMPLGLLAPRDGEIPSRSSIKIFALRKDGYSARVILNGEPVPNIHRAPAMASVTTNLNLDSWSGVSIREGRNRLELVLTAPDGTTLREEREILYTTRFDNVELVSDGSILGTDGRSTPVVKIRLTDGNGIPIRPGTLVNATISAPFSFEPEGDIRRSMDGSEKARSQVTTITIGQDGIGTMVLSPILVSETAKISFPRGAGEDAVSLDVRISAKDRPWVLVGIAEGSFAEGQILRHMRKAGDLGGIDDPYRGRIAFFAEGMIRGDWLLTMRYDSAKSSSDDFYEINPDKDYIVYGDASYQGNAAEGRFPLYIRMKRDEAEFLLGDFTASIDTSLLSLNRRLTGLKAEYEGESFRVLGFAAETGQRFVADRIALDGTSGPFDLIGEGILPGSETVRVITVSSRDATEELEEIELSAGIDYVLDRDRGRIFLRRPVSAFTSELDRNVLVVEYETDEDIKSGVFAGSRVEADITDSVTVGMTALTAEGLDGRAVDATALGADVSVKLSENLTLSAETLQVEKRGQSETVTGSANEVRLSYASDQAAIEAYLKSLEGPTNIDSAMQGDTVEIMAVEGEIRLSGSEDPEDEDGIYFSADLVQEMNRTLSEKRNSASGMLIRRTDGSSVGFGLEQSTVETEAGDGSSLKAISELGWTSEDGRLSGTLGLSKSLRNEGTIAIDDRLSLGAEYAMTDAVLLFGNYDRSINARQENAALSFGVTVTPWKGGSFTLGLIQAGDGGASGLSGFLGARQNFDVTEKTVLSFGMDMQSALSDQDNPAGATIGNPFIKEDFFTVTTGLRKTTDDWSAGIEIGLSQTDIRDVTTLRLAADGEVTDFWSVGAEYFAATGSNDGTYEKERKLRFGAAHRGEDRDDITILQAEADTTLDGDRKIYLSANHHRYIGEDASINLRGGVKWQEQSLSDMTYSDMLSFMAVENRYDLGEKFDIGLHASFMNSDASGQTNTGYGFSVGVTPFDNGQVNLGYNFEGFRDPDFSKLGYTDKGAFIEFRLKIDQNSFRNSFR